MILLWSRKGYLSAFGVVLTYKRELYDDLRSVFTIVRNESV